MPTGSVILSEQHFHMLFIIPDRDTTRTRERENEWVCNCLLFSVRWVVQSRTGNWLVRLRVEKIAVIGWLVLVGFKKKSGRKSCIIGVERVRY
jgi:hypothetical protein